MGNHKMVKLSSFEFWKSLGQPHYIVAPMVDASELAWRMLSRRHGAELCYTPMLHSSVFCRDPKYRKEALASCDGDRPLIVQFCGNEPKTMLEAALLAEEFCDGIDINLGCPQAIARRGHYGAFLQDEWELLTDIVRTLHKSLSVPVTCKIRVLEDVNRTVEYAKMLEAAGCQMLTVHGRTREQKGPLTGLADWEYVKAVREAVKIPIISNGNIQCLEDVQRCLEETGAVGVMTAEGNLYNPALFTGRNPPVWEPAVEYLELVEQYPCPSSYVRGHLFKLFHHLLNLEDNAQLRIELGAASNIDEFRRVTNELQRRYEPYHLGELSWSDVERGSSNLLLPPWLCHSHVRLPPDEHLKKMEMQKLDRNDENAGADSTKRRYEDADGNQITRKRMKKLRRIQRRPEKPNTIHVKRTSDKCTSCANPLGSKCVYKLCKKCCRSKCYIENLDCKGHRILVKTRREMAKHYASLQQNDATEKTGATALCAIQIQSN